METIRKLLGLKPAEQKKLEDQLAKLRKQKMALEEDQQTLIDELKKLKQRIKLLKEDYDRCTGPERKIIASRIEHALADLEGVEKKADILNENIRLVSLGIARIEEVIVAGKSGVTDVDFDELTLVHADAKDERTATRKAAEDLQKSTFEVEREPVDVDKEMRTLDRSASKKNELSKADQKKLKKLFEE